MAFQEAFLVIFNAKVSLLWVYLTDGCYNEYAKSSNLLHILKYLTTVEPLHKSGTNCSSNVC